MGEADANWDPMSEAYHSAEVNAYNTKVPSRHSGEENLCLFVSGFPSTVTSHAVRNLLSEAGQIQFVKTVPDRKKWNYVIAYVYAATYKDALAIIGGFNHFSFLNSTLRIGFTTKRKTLTDPAGQGNLGSAVETRGSLSGLNQTLLDVESLGARPGKADVMDFQRLGPQQSQQKPPMGRAKLLMSLTSDELKTTTIGHGVGMKSWSQPSAAPDRRGTLTADGDNAELLQNKYCDQLKQLSSDARRKDEEDKTKTRGPQSVSPRGLIPNERQVDNASTSSHSSVSSAKKCPDLCAFCQNPGQLLCSVCKTTYCSQSCQRIDWPHHKNVCQSKRSKSDSATNFADYENEFLVGVDVDELSSSLEINLPDGKKFATAHVKLAESSLPIDACTEVVLVTAPVSPSEIWVVEEKHSELLDNIKKSLRKHYSGVQNTQRSSSVQLMLNDNCVCLFSVDGCWYRTRVESVNRDGTYDVRYVDYGNMETVPSSRIDVLEEEFCSVPSLAVRCRLSDLVPADGSGVWSNRALKLCSDLLPVLHALNVRCIQKTANVHSIELVNAAGKRISDEFIEAGVAKHLSSSTKLPLSEKVQEEKISPTKCKDDDQLKVSLSPLPPSPSSGSEVVKEIVVSSPHGMPTASKHLFRGAKVLVKVLNLVSPTQFWVHLVSPVSSELEKLSELEASMKEHYEKKPSKKGFSLTARMLYAAKCSLTGRWLRVHVLNFDRSGVDAFLLDYGVCQAMSLVSLISLEGQFCSLPFQAVHCTLAGIKPKPGSTAWTQGTVTYLQRLIDHPSNAEHLEAAVCRVDGACAHLELMLPGGETINNLLVKYGMAEFAPDLQPGFFVLSRNLVSGGKAFSEGQASSNTSPLNLLVSPADHSTGERVEGLLKKLEAPPVHLPIPSATPKLKDLVRSPLATGKIHEVIVTDATHFFGFYVQIVTVDKATELQSLEEKINEIYGDYRGSFRPFVGDIVAARFTVDQKWYRGLVREVTSPDSALVMFLDYGNCDNVAVKFISPLDASLLAVPVFAYRCALLEPTGVVFVQPWNEDFLLPLSATFQMKVVKEKENVHVVDLFSKELNVNWKDKLLRDGVIQLKLTSAVDPLKPTPSSAGHSVSSSVGERVATSVTGNSRPKFEVGSAVCVVHINSVTDFYVHVKDKDLEKTFHDLMQRLKDECDKCPLSSYVPKGPGEVVAALYDHIWYRAKVLQMTSSTACRMEFVDFGNVDLVACSCLRPLPSGCQLDAVSEMAVPCCLFNLCASPKGGSGDCLDVETSKWFRRLCLEKQFIVTGMCNVVSNRYALDLRSTEMSGTVRDCYLKMFIDQKMSPLAESTSAGKPQTERQHVAQAASSAPFEQQPRAPLASSAQRPSDKRVHFANDLRAPPKAQSSGSNELGPAGSVQSGFRSTSNDQSNFKPISSQQYESRSTDNHQSGNRSTSNDQSNFKPISSQQYESRSTGNHQPGNKSTGGNWPDRNNPNTMNGTAPRSNQNSRPQFAESKQPESEFRDGNSPKITERHQADPVITEKRRSGAEVSENNELGRMIVENNVSGSKVTSAVAAEGSDRAADSRGCVVAEPEKSRHLQSLEKSDKVVLSRSSHHQQQLPVVNQSVSIVHINSPSDFYIQLSDEESKERMNKFLAEFHQCALALNATTYSNGRVGDCVAGLFDNCWFRAEVVELLPGDRARLFFVDYGNVSVVEYRNIRSTMPKDLLSRTWLAIRCAIEDVVGNEVNGEWSRDAIAWFSQRFENYTCTVKAVIIPSEGNQPCVVDLVGLQAKESVKEQIISNRFGEIVPTKRAEKTITLEKENKSTSAVTANNADGKLLGKVDKVGDDAAGLGKMNISSPTPMPCGAAVKVVHANKPSEFFVQSADESVQLSIAQVCLDLTAHCSDSTQNSYRPSAVGEYVAALFEGMWFRAQVRKILPHDQFELFFVDFGNCDIIGASNIRVLPAKFASVMPKQAISCGIVRLAGTDVAGKWSDESCAWFKGYCENFDFHVQAVALDESGKCLIDMLRTGDQHSIREQLLSSHRAVDLTNEAKLLSDSDCGRSKETNNLTASSSCDKSGSRVNAGNVSQPQSMLYPAERNRGATGTTVVHNQAEAQHTTRPTHDGNARNARSTAQELSSVVNRPNLSAIQSAASANITTSSTNHVSVSSNQPNTSTDLTKSSVNKTKSSVDSPRTAAVKPGSFTINCGDVVTIVHVNSPSDFYVQLQTDALQREIVEMLKKLNEWCTSSASGAKPYRPTGVGEIVGANFEGIWYRAEVLDFTQDSKFELQFIDYGNVDVFDVVDIRRLPATLINALPRQALPCAISGVKPVEPGGRWSPEAISWFQENTENVSSFVVRSSSLTHKGTYLVDVYTVLPNGNQELSLCEKLISLKFGRSTDTAAARNSQSTSDIRSSGQSNDRSVARSSGQLSDAAVRKDSSVGGQIEREARCGRSVFKFSDLPELRLSSDVTVEVTLPTDPGSFWCQDLMQMADMIKRFQIQESPPPSHPASASSGHHKVVTEKNEVCLGFHDKYGEWYRVVVKDIREDCLTVRFMDYGDEATVPFDHVRPFPAELKSFPPLAIHCSLAGITAVGGVWTEQAKAVFHSLVSSQILSASIKSHDLKTNDYKVILKVESSGQVVGDELVAAGLAKRV